MVKVTIYSTTTCQYCKMLREYLDSKNIKYQDKVMDKNPKYQDEMMKLSGGFIGTPFTVIKKDSGEEVKIKGFEKDKIDKALGLI